MLAHICRIARIISNPGGNAMLIGVGGSGKQSLSRMASFICGYEVKQLAVTSNFKVDDLKEALKHVQAGRRKGVPVTFLMTDTQIVNEKFPVYINDMLSTAGSPTSSRRTRWTASSAPFAMRPVAGCPGHAQRHARLLPLARARRTAPCVVLQPGGRHVQRARAPFPGLINCAAIDWFYAWPRDA